MPQSTALSEQIQTDAGQPQGTPGSSSDDNSAQSYAIVVLILFVLYALNNGLSCPEFLFKSRSSQRSQGRNYKPLAARQDEDQDESDEEVDPAARRMMELSSFGEQREKQERRSIDSYADSRQPQNEQALPMQNFAKKKHQEETDAVQL
jgi:hypothetical protein